MGSVRLHVGITFGTYSKCMLPCSTPTEGISNCKGAIAILFAVREYTNTVVTSIVYWFMKTLSNQLLLALTPLKCALRDLTLLQPPFGGIIAFSLFHL